MKLGWLTSEERGRHVLRRCGALGTGSGVCVCYRDSQTAGCKQEKHEVMTLRIPVGGRRLASCLGHLSTRLINVPFLVPSKRTGNLPCLFVEEPIDMTCETNLNDGFENASYPSSAKLNLNSAISSGELMAVNWCTTCPARRRSSGFVSLLHTGLRYRKDAAIERAER